MGWKLPVESFRLDALAIIAYCTFDQYMEKPAEPNSCESADSLRSRPHSKTHDGVASCSGCPCPPSNLGNASMRSDTSPGSPRSFLKAIPDGRYRRGVLYQVLGLDF